MKLQVLMLLLAVLGGTAAGQEWPFQQYPAQIFKEKPVPPRLETPRAREFRTRIRRGAARGPNFAGHYTVVMWGCGTACAAYVIVDAQTGKVYEPPEIRGVNLGIAGPEYRLDSTLMVVANCPPPDLYGLKDCKRRFYRWDGARLVLLKTEAVTSAEIGR